MSEAFELTKTGDGTLEIHESRDNRESRSTMVSYIVEPGNLGEEELDQTELAHTENTEDVDNAAETPKTRKKRPDRELDENWLKIYASRQNRGIIEELVVGIEKHDLYEETIPCLRVNIGNVKGLVPIQEAGVETREELRRLVGQKLPFIVIGIMEEANLCLLSHRAAVQRLAARTWKEIKEGQVREARVTRVGRRRAILDISGVPGVLEAREYDWGWTDDLSARLKVNETLSVLVLSVDREKERVTVSRRALLPDPWPGIEERYKVGDEIAGRVTGVEKYGIFVNLEPGIDALTPHMVRGYPMVGDYLYVRITGIDPEKRHIRARVIRRLNIAG